MTLLERRHAVDRRHVAPPDINGRERYRTLSHQRLYRAAAGDAANLTQCGNGVGVEADIKTKAGRYFGNRTGQFDDDGAEASECSNSN